MGNFEAQKGFLRWLVINSPTSEGNFTITGQLLFDLPPGSVLESRIENPETRIYPTLEEVLIR